MKLSPILAACMTVLLMVAVSPAFASSVAYTYTLADLGQGGWGGGPLFTDGKAGGANGISFGNGADVGTFRASTWTAGTSAITGGPGVDICGTLTVAKSDGTATGLPAPGVYPGFCLSNVIRTDLPITGAPVVVFGTIVRVTPVG